MALFCQTRFALAFFLRPRRGVLSVLSAVTEYRRYTCRRPWRRVEYELLNRFRGLGSKATAGWFTERSCHRGGAHWFASRRYFVEI